MSTESQHLISKFESLPIASQREVAAEILRRAMEWNTPPLADNELLSAADDVFCELDRNEEEHES